MMDFSQRYNRENFVAFLRNEFLPEDDFLTETKEETIQQSANYIKKITQLGTCKSLNLSVFEARHTSTNDARVGLSKEIFRFMANRRERKALVLFVPQGNDANYRFSLISIDLDENEKGDIQRKYSNPRRYSYYLGVGVATRTPNDYLIKKKRVQDTTDLAERFSVEILNNEFFKEYKAQYQKFCDFLVEDSEMRQSFAHFLDQEKAIRDYVKKMLGRIVFLYFVQRKGWLGGNYRYMSQMFKTSTDEVKADFLDRVLEPMFFGLLNTPPVERANKAKKNNWNLSLIPDWEKVPYLNGGLFEQDEIDKCKSVFPKAYFEQLFEFFDTYNFTVDENDPDDNEVGIDPEMLGHIFENLLEDNKDKGAFYTPKEIVQYMCRESVIQYLKTHEPDMQSETIEHLIRDGEVDKELQEKSKARKLTKLLAEVKVCDPAIGSGAFPMGVLSVLYHARRLLYGFTDDNQVFSPTAVKREIIQNNIYGVDIEQGAVDIARLRFWLSLVVDETEPQPLPNLDYKIMQGNSLLESFMGYDLSQILPVNKDGKVSKRATTSSANDTQRKIVFGEEQESIAEIQKLMRLYFSPEKHLNKEVLKQDISDKVKDHIIICSDSNPDVIKAVNEIKEANKPFFLWHLYFADVFQKGGFDIVIGNPPYLRIQGLRTVYPDSVETLVKQYKAATGSFDLYALFTERSLQIIHNKGIVNFIMPVKWTNAAFGKGLREILAKKKAVSKIIHFGAYQVFYASTYTGLHWFIPNSPEILYYELDKNLLTNQELEVYLRSITLDNATKVKIEKLNSAPWVLTAGKTSQILDLLEKKRHLNDVFEKIFQGIATSKDDVYFLYNCKVSADYVSGESKQIGRIVKVERGLVRPLLKGEDIHRYDSIYTDKYVIFPYEIINGKASLYREDKLASLFPLGYSYLKECEKVLRAREKGRFNIDGEWFQFGRKQGILFAEQIKLVAPDISMGSNFAYDSNGEFYSTTTIYGYIKKESTKESYKFWLALLNSRLCWWFMEHTGTTLANGFFRYKPDYIKPLPIPDQHIILENEAIIMRLVDFLLFLHNPDKKEIFAHTANMRIASHIEEILDMVIYELYFEDHMKKNGINVIMDLKSYQFLDDEFSAQISRFYSWYQKSDNPIRQKIMLLETRSYDLVFNIHTKSKI